MIRQASKRLFIDKEDESFYLMYDEVLGIEDEIKIEFDKSGNVLSAESKHYFCNKNNIGWQLIRKEQNDI